MSTGAEPVRLTSLSPGAGCGCKLGPDELASVLKHLPGSGQAELLVGADHRDDAAVYRLNEELAIVSTADFFTPIVDDPFDFGRIAAANALSDIYAMGAKPIFALNLVAFSVRELGADILERILAGGLAVAEEAGIPIAGGHSIDDREPKYGMAVTGTVHPKRILTNGGARAGDLLYLTKPLGSGLIATAAKRDLASTDLIARATDVMMTLNAEASRCGLAAGATAMTDVTGFGLLGHLHELCIASEVAAEVYASEVPTIEGALALGSDRRCVSGGTRRNAEHAEAFVGYRADVSPAHRALVSDATTSGGLLLAIPPENAERAPGRAIGALVTGAPGSILVRA